MNKISSKILAISLAGFITLSTLSMASAVPYDKAELTQEKLETIDFSSKRLLVKGDSSILETDADVIDSYQDVYLLGFKNEEDTKNAFEVYYKKADIVVPDYEIAVSDFNKKEVERKSSDDIKPFASLKDDNITGVTILNINNDKENSNEAESKNSDSSSTIAIIDTGVSESVSGSIENKNFTDSEKEYDVYGHGSAIYKEIKNQDNDSDILSAKAVNDTGLGTVSSIYAAIKYADEKDADFINISSADYFKLSNPLIDNAIDEASQNGAVVVISAAGDDDKNEITYEKIDNAVIVGNCSDNGESNLSEGMNDEADYNVISDNAETASAKFTGWIAYNYNKGFIKYESVDSEQESEDKSINNFNYYKDAIEDILNEGYVYNPDYKAPTKNDNKKNYKSAGNGETTVIDGTGQDVVDYALGFVGNPYVWGGEDLENGVDCSGYTLKIYQHFGIALPHDAELQANYGIQVSEDDMLPGDLVFYYDNDGTIGHVAIYMGNGQVVHASNHIDGIKISNQYNYRSVACVTRLIQPAQQAEADTFETHTATDAQTDENNKIDEEHNDVQVTNDASQVADTENSQYNNTDATNTQESVINEADDNTQNNTTESGSWKQDDKGDWYEYSDGSYPADQWAVIDGSKYYFNEAGYMALDLSSMKFAVASVNNDKNAIDITEPQNLTKEGETEVTETTEIAQSIKLNDDNIKTVSQQEHTIILDSQFKTINKESLNTDLVKEYITGVLTPVKATDDSNIFYELNKDAGYHTISPEVPSELKNGDLMYFGGEWYAFVFIDSSNYGWFKLDTTKGIIYEPNIGFTLDGTFYRKEIKKSSITVPDDILCEKNLELYSISLPEEFIWYDESQIIEKTDFYQIVFTNQNILSVLPEKKTVQISITSTVKPADSYNVSYTKSLKLKNINLPEGWKFENEDTTLDVGTNTYTAVNGKESKQVSVKVEKAKLTVQGAMITVVDSTKLTNDILPKYDNGHLEWKEAGKVVKSNITLKCSFIPNDTKHYETAEVDVIVNVVPKTVVEDSTNTNNTDNSSKTNNDKKTDTDKSSDTKKNNTTDKTTTPDVPKINIDTDKSNTSDKNNSNSNNNSSKNNNSNNNSNSDSSNNNTNNDSSKKNTIKINLNSDSSNSNKSNNTNNQTNKTNNNANNNDTKKDDTKTEAKNIDITSKNNKSDTTDDSDKKKVYIPNIDLTTGDSKKTTGNTNKHTNTDADVYTDETTESDANVVSIDLTTPATSSDATETNALDNIEITSEDDGKQNVTKEAKQNSGVLGTVIAGAAILGAVGFLIFKSLRKRRYK